MIASIPIHLIAAVASIALAAQFEFQFQQDVAQQPALRLYGPNVRQVAKTDSQGLRLNLPAGRSDRGAVGVESRFQIRGDFEITLGYELLSVPEPAPADGAGVSLWLKFDTPTPNRASLTRLKKGENDVFGASRITVGPKGHDLYQTKNIPAKSTQGKLRLVRTGPTLHFLVTDGTREFREFHSTEVGTEDVTSLRALCQTAGKPAAADVRLIDWTIRAEELPNPSVVQAPEASGWKWVLIGVGGALFLGLGGFTILYLRRRPKGDQPNS
jgi:hypothetical protein